MMHFNLSGPSRHPPTLLWLDTGEQEDELSDVAHGILIPPTDDEPSGEIFVKNVPEVPTTCGSEPGKS